MNTELFMWVILGLVGLVMLAGAVGCWLYARRLRRREAPLGETIQRVLLEQSLLARGYHPEFDARWSGNCQYQMRSCRQTGAACQCLMQRYLSGENVPLRWRSPEGESGDGH